MRHVLTLWAICAVLTPTASAQSTDAFHAGPAIPSFGNVATVEADMTIPEGTRFRVVFDTGSGAEPGTLNRTLNSAARFINMHVEAGVDPDDIEVAVVVHGSAAYDVTQERVYQNRYDATNANAAAVEALLQNNTQVILCGQTAAYRGLSKKDLLPGVKVALSAMTAHALLLQQGFTPNPF